MVTVSARWRLALALFLVLCAGAHAAEPGRIYNIDLPEQGLADALNGLSEQTGAPIVFPYDLVRNRTAGPLTGRYTVLGALDALLRDTGLSGGLSDKGVLTISDMKSGARKPGETLVTNAQNPQNSKKTASARPAGVAAFFASLVASFSASAEDAASDQPTASSEIVVTAQKREERLQDVPVPVSVIDTGVLADTSQVLLRDYASAVPGFNVTPGLVGHQTLAIRGITTGGFTPSTVGVMIDELPYGSSVSGLNEVPDVDPSDLERIEVLRGPQGTLYGASSMGGLVKFVTKDPSTAGVSGRVEAGTSDVYNGAQPGYSLRAAANIPLSDTVAIRMSTFERQDPGYIDNPVSGQNGVNEARAYGGRISALWRPSESFSVKLSGLYQNYKADDTSEVYELPGLGPWEHNSVPGSGLYERRIQAYDLTVKAKLGAVDLTSLSGYSTNKYNVGTDYTVYFGPATQQAFGVPSNAYFQYGHNTKFTEELRLSGSITSRFDWLAGLFYTLDGLQPDMNHDYAVDPVTGKVVGLGFQGVEQQDFREYAGFADLTYHFTDQFSVQVGGRESALRQAAANTTYTGPLTVPIFGGPSPVFAFTDAAKSNVFTYLFSPQYNISRDLMTYVRLASGYRPGGPNTPLPGVSAQYDPDKTKNYEVGLKGDFLDHVLSVDASLYYIQWDKIQVALHTPSGLPYETNGGAAKSEGVELSLGVKPLPGLTISAWVDYDDAVLTQAFPAASTAYGAVGDRLPYSSRFSGNLELEQEFHLWNEATGFAAAQASYSGDRLGVFSSSSLRQVYPSYTKTDLRAGVKNGSWTTTVYATNVGNVRGELSGGLGYYLPYSFVDITPRTVGVTVSKAF